MLNIKILKSFNTNKPLFDIKAIFKKLKLILLALNKTTFYLKYTIIVKIKIRRIGGKGNCRYCQYKRPSFY